MWKNTEYPSIRRVRPNRRSKEKVMKTTKEKMKEYTRMTGSTEQATRLIEAESRSDLAASNRQLAEALEKEKKQGDAA